MEELNYNLGFDCDKHTAVLIDKETGEVHKLGKIINAKILEENNDVKISAKGNDWNVECTWVKPLSKRKARKFRYFIERLCKPIDRKYIPKREIIEIIFKRYVDTGIVQALKPREYYMGFSRKKLQNMHRDVSLYAFVHSKEYSFYAPQEPEEYPSNTKEYFGDPMIVQKPPQGFEKGGACHA